SFCRGRSNVVVDEVRLQREGAGRPQRAVEEGIARERLVVRLHVVPAADRQNLLLAEVGARREEARLGIEEGVLRVSRRAEGIPGQLVARPLEGPDAVLE